MCVFLRFEYLFKMEISCVENFYIRNYRRRVGSFNAVKMLATLRIGSLQVAILVAL